MPEAVFCRKIKVVKTNTLQPDYTITGNVYQLVIPMDIDEMIPADDSVRILSAVLERMGLSKITCGILSTGENRVLTEKTLQGTGIRIHERHLFQPKTGAGLPARRQLHVSAGPDSGSQPCHHRPLPKRTPERRNRGSVFPTDKTFGRGRRTVLVQCLH